MNVTGEFLKPYIKEKKRHRYYEKTVELAESLLIHFDGKFPERLIGKRRPSESAEIFKFRKEIYECPTSQDCDMVTNSLMKIRKSDDWSIKYADDESSLIRAGESLEDYMEKKFPKHASFTNWVFQYGLKQWETDPNSVVLWKQMEQVDDNEFKRPYPFVFNSKQVYDRNEEFFLLLSNETATYTEGKREYTDGKIFYYVDNTFIVTLTQKNAKEDYKVDSVPHGLKRKPIALFSAVIAEESQSFTLLKSRLHAMVPSMNEAVREYSDMQAEIVQHIHSMMWAYETQKCTDCNGNGVITVKDKPAVKCKSCKGKGTIPFDPYQIMSIRVPGSGESPLPTPFAGYVQKQIDIAILQDKRIWNHRSNALGACNMQFLLSPPALAQSGISKEVDRSELNNFVHGCAEDIVKFMDDSYSIAGEYRYGVVIENETERMKLLPKINVPQKFDLVSEGYLAEEISRIQKMSVSKAVINASLKEYVTKKFNADSLTRDYVNDVIDLDPFASADDSSLLTQKQNDGIKETDYVIHCNIDRLVQDAYETVKGFAELPLTDKRKEIEKLAATLSAEIKATSEVTPTNKLKVAPAVA